MKIVDVDTHSVETASVWDYLAASEQEYQPSILRKEVGATIQAHFAGPKTAEFWVIDNFLYGKHDARAIAGYSNGEFTADSITLDNIATRLADLDRQKVDTQIIFSSLFLNVRCTRPRAELALTRAYNRWIADRCQASNGRLRWIFVPSLKNPDETVKDMRWAREHGAVGILFRGIEGDKFLDHSDFDPIYAQAVELDWPICVHIGHGSPAFESIAQRDGAKFNRFISDSPNYFAFSTILNSQLPAQFPQLRFGFFESGCTWVAPAVQTALHVRLAPADLMQLVQQKLAEHNFFITCELHEDLPNIMRYTGEDRLMLGSDYGHPGDIADTILFRQALDQRADIPQAARDKLVSDNGLRLFRL
jgi:predicted TIM-barrel fold metal-dependent hydrolase